MSREHPETPSDKKEEVHSPEMESARQAGHVLLVKRLKCQKKAYRPGG